MHSLSSIIEDPVASDGSSSTRWRTPADLHWGRGISLSGLQIERGSSSWKIHEDTTLDLIKILTYHNPEIPSTLKSMELKTQWSLGPLIWQVYGALHAVHLQDIGVRGCGQCGGIC